MSTRRRFLMQASIAGLGLHVHLANESVVAAQATPEPNRNPSTVLDGQEPLDAEGLAAIARNRVALAVKWLAQMLRPIGTFYYIYDPTQDLVEDQEYH